MVIKVKKSLVWQAAYVLIVILTATAVFLGSSFVSDNVFGINVTNSTVIAKVNITNTEPSLYYVSITSPSLPIDLSANSITLVMCNGSFRDINGFTDIRNVSATFYDLSVGSGAPDKNNTHYTNSSCGTCIAIPNSNNQNGTCSCLFPVQYYANPTSWQCNMTVNDSGGLMSSQNSSAVTVNEVIGINIPIPVIDYGNLSASTTSNPIGENVTNTGNIPINISLRGYAGSDETIGQNLSMICEAGSNMTFGSQRYFPSNDTAFSSMYNLTNKSMQFTNLTIPQRTTDGSLGNSSNTTFWKLQVPPGASGVCNGTIIFGAVDATLT